MKNKILIFLFSFVFVFNINVIDSFANPILIPEIIIDYVEYVTSAAGVRYKNREQVYSVAQGYYDNMSELEKADLYQEAEGYAVSSNDTDYYVKDGFDILWKLDKVAFSVLKDVLKERIFDFTNYIMNKIVDGSASLDFVNDSFLDSVFKDYNLPSLSLFSGQPGGGSLPVSVSNSLAEFVTDEFFVYLVFSDSIGYTLYFIPHSYDNILILQNNGRYCFSVKDYCFSYKYVDSNGFFWKNYNYGKLENFFHYLDVDLFLDSSKGKVLFCNKTVILPDGESYKLDSSDNVDFVNTASLVVDSEQLDLNVKNTFSESGKLKLDNEIDSKADEADKVVLLGPTVTEDGELDYSLTDKLGTTFVPTTDLLDKAGQTYKDPITTEADSYNWLSKFWIGLSNAFVPNEYLLKVELLGLQSSFDKKFSISDTFNLLSVFDSADSVDLPDFYFPLFGNKYLICTGAYILEFTKDFRNLLRAFLWFCLVLVDIDQIYFIVRGVRLIRSIGSVDGGGSE